MREIRTSGSVGASGSNLRGDPTPPSWPRCTLFKRERFWTGEARIIRCCCPACAAKLVAKVGIRIPTALTDLTPSRGPSSGFARKATSEPSSELSSFGDQAILRCSLFIAEFNLDVGNLYRSDVLRIPGALLSIIGRVVILDNRPHRVHREHYGEVQSGIELRNIAQ